MTYADCKDMGDYLHDLGETQPEEAGSLYRKAKALGYEEPEHFGRTLFPRRLPLIFWLVVALGIAGIVFIFWQ